MSLKTVSHPRQEEVLVGLGPAVQTRTGDWAGLTRFPLNQVTHIIVLRRHNRVKSAGGCWSTGTGQVFPQ